MQAYNKALGSANEVIFQHEDLVRRITRRYATNKNSCTFDDLCAAGRSGIYYAYLHFDPSRGRWISFATLCIESEIKKLIGKAYREPLVLSLDAPIDDTELSLIETLQDESEDDSELVVKQFMNGLSQVEQAVVKLKIQGYPYREIANLIGVKEVQVKRIVQQIRACYPNGPFHEWKEEEAMKDGASISLDTFEWVRPGESESAIRITKNGIRVTGAVSRKLDTRKMVEVGFAAGYIAIRNNDKGWRLKQDSKQGASVVIPGKSVSLAVIDHGLEPGTVLKAEWNNSLHCIIAKVD